MRQRSKTTSPSGMPRIPIARSRRVTASPGVSASTIRAPIPAEPGYAVEATEHHVGPRYARPRDPALRPGQDPRVTVSLGPHLELRRRRPRAVSVMAIAGLSPRGTLGKYFCFCASVPSGRSRRPGRGWSPPGLAPSRRRLAPPARSRGRRRGAAGPVPRWAGGDGHAQEPRLDEPLDVVPRMLLELVPAGRTLAELVVGQRAGAPPDDSWWGSAEIASGPPFGHPARPATGATVGPGPSAGVKVAPRVPEIRVMPGVSSGLDATGLTFCRAGTTPGLVGAFPR